MGRCFKYELPFPPSISGIYEIHNTRDGRKYIGSAVSILKRWIYHKYRLSNNTHPNRRMQAVWNKYGESIFSIHVVEGVARANLLKREQFWLDKTKAAYKRDYYNFLPTAGSHLGKKRSKKTKMLLSKAFKGRKFSDETKEKMRQAKIGIKLTPEHRKAIGDSHRGKPCNRPTGIINHKLRKFTSTQVRRIRQRKADGWSYSRLKKEYNTCLGPLFRIVNYVCYRDVT